jgi:hypothetical protein
LPGDTADASSSLASGGSSGAATNRVGILAGYAELVAFDVDGEAAAQRLRDVARLAGSSLTLIPAGTMTASTSRETVKGSL